jgi:hypothetical protein
MNNFIKFIKKKFFTSLNVPIIFCIILGIIKNVHTTIINIPGDQPTIQAGIEAAQNGDTVLVSPNIYTENINFSGKQIVVASHYILNLDLSFITSTIIDGSNPANPDTASCVAFYSGEDSNAVLQGFTISGGTGTKWIDPQNPGWIWRGGGGIFTFGSSPVIKNNRIINNNVTNTTGVNGAQGGGTLSYAGNPKILNNIIMQNEARYGGGVVIDYSGGIIKNNIIYKNFGGQDYGGGGIWTIGNGAKPIIIVNNHIIENTVTGSGTYGGRGGAMFIWMGTITARNNIFWGNIQSQGGPIAQIGGGTAIITYSNVEGGFSGTGNININPAFADSNFHLSQTSPCIDKGNPDSLYNDTENLNNPGFAEWPSLGNIRNDMGAYGGSSRKFFPFFFVTKLIKEENLIPQKLHLNQNYPNPFNSETTLKINLTKSSQIKIIFYNIKGQVVKTLLNGQYNSGQILI